MKWNSRRLFVLPLMAVLLCASVPNVRALDPTSYQSQDSETKKRKKALPEGSGSVLLVLAAGALGGGLIVWRRKKRGTAA